MNFDKIYADTLTYKVIETGRLPEIRASSAPFCPKKFLFNYYEQLKNNGSKLDFNKEFYTRLGSTIHSIIQNWITKPEKNRKILFGNWKCTNCNKKYSWTISETGYCKKCSTPLEYEELELHFPDAKMSGHCDGVLLDYKSIKNGVIDGWVLELKSTSSYSINSMREPKHEHKLQAKLYVVALRKILKDVPISKELKKFGIKKINIKGCIIKYLSRERPDLRSPDFKFLVKKETVYKVMCNLINLLKHSVKNNDISEILKTLPCKKYPNIYRNCSASSLCLESKTVDNDIKEIFNELLPNLKQLFGIKI